MTKQAAGHIYARVSYLFSLKFIINSTIRNTEIDIRKDINKMVKRDSLATTTNST